MNSPTGVEGMSDEVTERLGELEEGVRRAGALVVRLREDHARRRRVDTRLEDERRQVVTQLDAILKDIGKLDLS